MIYEFLISTINRTDLRFLENIFVNNDISQIHGVVVNQCINIPVTDIKSPYPNIKCYSVNEKGISKSRNLALEKSSGDYCIIADDDIVYPSEINKKFEALFKNNEDADILTFCIETPEGIPYKNYSKKSYIVRSPLYLMKISSVEISFKRESVIESEVRFNTRLGLGSEFCVGEEIYFLHDCKKSGLKIKYLPEKLVKHHLNSSGKKFTQNSILANGIMNAKLFPILFPIVNLYFSVKRYKRYKKHYHLLTYMSLFLVFFFIY